MAELDVEALKRRVDEMAVSQGMPGIKAAITAALEDCERLRAVLTAAEKLDASRDLPDPRLRDIIPLLDGLSDAVAKYRGRDG